MILDAAIIGLVWWIVVGVCFGGGHYDGWRTQQVNKGVAVTAELAHAIRSFSDGLATQEQKQEFIRLLDRLAPDKHLGAFVKLEYRQVFRERAQ